MLSEELNLPFKYMWWLGAILFLLLQPGFLLEIPSKKLWMTRHTSTNAVLVHAALFAIAMYFASQWYGTYEGFKKSSKQLPVSKACYDTLMGSKMETYVEDTIPNTCKRDKKNATIYVNMIVSIINKLKKNAASVTTMTELNELLSSMAVDIEDVNKLLTIKK